MGGGGGGTSRGEKALGSHREIMYKKRKIKQEKGLGGGEIET